MTTEVNPEDLVGLENGDLIIEGKTKKVLQAKNKKGILPGYVIVENKPDLTANDDKKLTRQFPNKVRYATATACGVFELLEACGIPTAYVKQLSETSFLMKSSKMIPLEIVARRYAVGSYLKRHPELITEDAKKPHRFHRLETEFFLKTTDRKFGNIISNLETDDPLIINPSSSTSLIRQLAHPKKPSWEGSEFPQTISLANILASTNKSEAEEKMVELDLLARKVFLVLEKAWANLGLDLIDIKIEVDSEGRVSDVVDNDSWRLWLNGEQLDKQVFRDKGGAALDEIEKKYGQVAELVKQLTIPEQALIFWRGSTSDPLPEIPTLRGVTIVNIDMSGHKTTVESLKRAEKIFSTFPQGGVFVCEVGRSNGLGPILASHVPWPVISCPATLKEFPNDIWSSLRMPSDVPLLAAWPEANAVNAALGILAQTNPEVYAHLQLKRESMDNYIV